MTLVIIPDTFSPTTTTRDQRVSRDHLFEVDPETIAEYSRRYPQEEPNRTKRTGLDCTDWYRLSGGWGKATTTTHREPPKAFPD
jgi:hypothetical protein